MLSILASNTFFLFFEFFPSVLLINVTDASCRQPLWLSVWKSLHKCFCIQDSFLSNFPAFIVIPSITKLICSFTHALFVTLLAGHKIDETLIVTMHTMVNLKVVSNHCATKYRSVSDIIANFTSSFTLFWGNCFSLQWT